MGLAAGALHEYAEAYNYFRRYLDGGGAEIGQERRALVEGELVRLGSYLGRLEFVVNVEKAEILVDGVLVGTTPLGKALVVSAGRRVVRVARVGHADWERSLDVVSEQIMKLNVELISIQPTIVAAQPAVATRKQRRSRLGVGFWLSASSRRRSRGWWVSLQALPPPFHAYHPRPRLRIQASQAPAARA